MIKKILLAFALVAFPFICFSGGYQVNLIGIRYIGMGHIGTALALDAGAIFFNPGNLALIKSKYSFTGSVSGIKSYTQFRYSEPSLYQANTDNPLSTPFSVFGSVKINDKLAVGFGVYTPFGSHVVWDDNWIGRYLIQDISLRTILFQPTVSYKIHEKISIGAGLVLAYGSVNLTRALPVSGANNMEGQVELKGSTVNAGFNAGIGFQATENLSVGFSYRSRINMKVENGDANFAVPASLTGNFPTSNRFNSSIPLPANWNLGISYRISEKFLIGADVNLVQWNAYDSLIFDFENNTASLPDSRNPRLFENTLIYRAGVEYHISDMFQIRAGVYYDNSPVNDNYFSPETPDANRIGLSAGLSVKPVERLSIDVSFLYINAEKRAASYQPANFSGTYKTLAYIPGIGLSYNF